MRFEKQNKTKLIFIKMKKHFKIIKSKKSLAEKWQDLKKKTNKKNKQNKQTKTKNKETKNKKTKKTKTNKTKQNEQKKKNLKMLHCELKKYW